MTTSYTNSETTTFTITHAKHIAAKFAADLKRIQRFYNRPNDTAIAKYEAEVIALLKYGYLGTLTVGFIRNGGWVEPTLQYTASALLGHSNDDDPGRVKPGANIDGASFFSFLTYSAAWYALTIPQREAFKKEMPFYRNGANEPVINGYLVSDLVYSSGGRSLNRSSVRNCQ